VKNKNFNNKVKLLKDLLNHDLKLINFFHVDITKYKILLLTMKGYYQNENQTIEKIVNNLPKNISSRAHQLNCITNATSKGYLIKETAKSDKRKKYLKPSKNLIDEFEHYIEIFLNK